MARSPIEKENRIGDPRNAIIDRRQFESQLFDAKGNPTRVMYEFCGRMDKEAGNLGREGQLAWAETLFNRCASRGHTIDYELRNHGRYSYWPKFQPEPGTSNKKSYVDIITEVCRNGTNLTLGATGNASLGVGVGRKTHHVKGEDFGVETPDNNWWKNKFGSLIRGVGKFIGDIAGAIGQGIAAVAKGVVEVGKWIFKGAGSLFSPQAQAGPPIHPHGHPPHQMHQDRGHGQAVEPQHHQVNRQPELRPQIPRVETGRWLFNVPPQPAPSRTEVPDHKTETRPRPS